MTVFVALQVLDLPGPVKMEGRRPPLPQYMLNLYNQIADSDGITRGKNPYGAEIIRSYRLSEEQTLSAGVVLTFNISGLKPGENILEADLHLFRTKSKKAGRHSRHRHVGQVSPHIPIFSIRSGKKASQKSGKDELECMGEIYGKRTEMVIWWEHHFQEVTFIYGWVMVSGD